MNPPPDPTALETDPPGAAGDRLSFRVIDEIDDSLERILAIANLLMLVRLGVDRVTLGERTIPEAATLIETEARRIHGVLREAESANPVPLP